MQLARRTREAAPPEIPRFARNELSTWWDLLASKIRSPQPAVYPERSEGSPVAQRQTHHATSPTHARQFIPSAARDLRLHSGKRTMRPARRTREAAPPEIPRFARNELGARPGATGDSSLRSE